MKAQTIGVIAFCVALAGCNSKPAEEAATPTEAAQANTSVAPPPVPAAAMKPAPEGLPSRIAREVIAASGQKCDGVAKADRDAKDGTIVASCTGGVSYRVYTEEGRGPVATAM